MPRANRPALKLWGALDAAGIKWSKSQVARALNEGLGALDHCPDELAHWGALDGLRAGPTKRLPEADVTALQLAIAGFACLRLSGAVLRLGATTEESDEAREEGSLDAERSVEEALAGGAFADKSYGARLANAFIDNSRAGGPVRRGVVASDEDVELEHVGRAQAVLDDFDFKVRGASSEHSLNVEDMAAVTRYSEETVETTIGQFDLVLGNDWLGNLDRLVEEASTEELVAAVQAANALVPIYSAKFVSLEGKTKWNVLAVTVPAVLALVGLLPSGFAGSADSIAQLRAVLDLIEQSEGL